MILTKKTIIMPTSLVPKLSLTPVKFNRLESLTEDAVSSQRLPETERYDEESPKGKKKLKKRLSRRDSMMNVLRDELKNMESLPALKTHRAPSVMDEWMNGEEGAHEDLLPISMRSRNRRYSVGDSEYMRGHLPVSRRSISGGSDDVIVSGYELKKIRMLQSLESMGVAIPRKRVQRNSTSDEREILQSMEFAKRQSLSTRLLQTVNKKPRFRHRSRSHSRSEEVTMQSPVREQSQTKDAEDDESRDQVNTMLKAVTKKVIDPNNQVVFGNAAVKNVSYDLGNDVIGSFRRKIRRRKVAFTLVFERITLDFCKNNFHLLITQSSSQS